MVKRIILALTLLFLPLVALPASALAVDVINNNLCERSTEKASSSGICKDNNNIQTTGENPLFGPEGVMAKIIKLLSAIIGIIAVIIIVVAGLRFVTSGSNPQDAANARERVIYALVALVIASLAQIFVRVILGRI